MQSDEMTAGSSLNHEIFTLTSTTFTSTVTATLLVMELDLLLAVGARKLSTLTFLHLNKAGFLSEFFKKFSSSVIFARVRIAAVVCSQFRTSCSTISGTPKKLIHKSCCMFPIEISGSIADKLPDVVFDPLVKVPLFYLLWPFWSCFRVTFSSDRHFLL